MGLLYTTSNHTAGGRPSQLFSSSSTTRGQFIRLAFATDIPSHNSMAFDVAESGAFEQMVFDFDFRLSPGTGQADGFGVAFLHTSNYGATGPSEPQAPHYAGEEPNFVDSLGIGFDIHEADVGGDARDEINNNHLSFHFGLLLQEVDASPFDLASGEWSHARIVAKTVSGQSVLSVELSRCDQPTVTVMDEVPIPGFTPYEGRLYIAARSGGESAEHDFDNIVIQSLLASQIPGPVELDCGVEPTPEPAGPGTHQTFDMVDQGTIYTPGTHLPSSPGPARLDGGPTGAGAKLRLAYGTDKTHNSIAFDLTDPGSHNLVIADFDFLVRPETGRADGFGYALLNTTTYSTSGVVPPVGVAEEPNFADSLGIGFDIYQSPDIEEINNNHLSIHYGSRRAEIDLRPFLDIAEGEWIHAQIVMNAGGESPSVSVILTQCGRPPVTVVDQFPIPDLLPYEGRAYFAARSGGLTADQDIDNVHVSFLDAETALIGFNTGCASVDERAGQISLDLTRMGNLSDSVSVGYTTLEHTATAGADYDSASGTVTFGPGERSKSLSVSIRDDDFADEMGESFLVTLNNLQGEGRFSGPSTVKVTLIDDETARVEGHWGALIPSQVVPIQLMMLPTGKIMYWDRHDRALGLDGNPRLMDPATLQITKAATVTYDLFCSGHSFMEDGRMLVAGGHVKDSVGEDKASIYNPYTDSWERLPDMNAGRWYPSQVTLADGGTLVLAGTFEQSIDGADRIVLNSLPQVWPVNGGNWRNLMDAKYGDFADQPSRYPFDYYPDHADYYPFTYAAANGQVFVAGPQQMSRYLDTNESGTWSDITSSQLEYRDYGTSVMFDDNKILIAGGNPRDPELNTTPTILPSASVEIIDLSDDSPTWQEAAPMHRGRRQLNSTLLPDGTVLVTGGSSAPGFDVEAGAVLEAELWNPELDEWMLLAPQARYRGYHSTAMLLPDGRVITGGGGHPNPQRGAQYNFEIYSPPYLFKGPRPVIQAAPESVSYGEQFAIQADAPSTISKVNWIRLSAVTHAFNQSQRINRLAFEQSAGSLTITTPSDPNLAQPGHYMLFILNEEGLPSVAKIVQLRSND